MVVIGRGVCIGKERARGQDFYGSSIAVIVHSFDHSLFSRLMVRGEERKDGREDVGFRSGFGFFGRHEISIFLVLRAISDGFPLNPTYRLNRDREIAPT